MSKIKVKVNKEECIKCGACYSSLPEVFQASADGSSEVKEEFRDKEVTDQSMIDKIKSAQSACPTQAIKIEEING